MSAKVNLLTPFVNGSKTKPIHLSTDPTRVTILTSQATTSKANLLTPQKLQLRSTMPPKIADPYTFDPEGDLVLLLSKPPKTTNAEDQNSAEEAADPSSNKRKRVPSTKSVPVAEAEKISMVVSSKHMMLASPVFKAMLAPEHFREGLVRNAAGQMEVDLPDDDQAVMIIVLNIIHSRNRIIPKHVDLEVLTKLTILVDKYQIVESVEFFAHTWIDHVLTKTELPNRFPKGDELDYPQSIQTWIAISWLFRREKEFSKITKAAIICGSTILVNELDIRLPIPGKIIGRHIYKHIGNNQGKLTLVRNDFEKTGSKDVRVT